MGNYSYINRETIVQKTTSKSVLWNHLSTQIEILYAAFVCESIRSFLMPGLHYRIIRSILRLIPTLRILRHFKFILEQLLPQIILWCGM